MKLKNIREIKASVKVSDTQKKVESLLFYSYFPLGKYYRDAGMDEREKIERYDKKMMELKHAIEEFREEFEKEVLGG